MDVGQILRTCRVQRGLSLRELGVRASTSHSTLAAYEAGRKVPGADTLVRILRATGHDLVIGSVAIDLTGDGGRSRGEQLEEVLALADQLPRRHAPTLDAPIFPAP
ncbi:MAG: helix-turn-helix transcriptional regulator [Acidimicrobiales bacterium]|nr:helix-turn-helix transcriptional regulator [Acidimicrobiales bacterium]